MKVKSIDPMGICRFIEETKKAYMELTVDTFKHEINTALTTYDKYVVCLEKTPEDFERSVVSLVDKAINAFVNRSPSLRHGIALDKQMTVILSQTDHERPLCGIYFNLHTPYYKEPKASALADK